MHEYTYLRVEYNICVHLLEYTYLNTMYMYVKQIWCKYNRSANCYIVCVRACTHMCGCCNFSVIGCRKTQKNVLGDACVRKKVFCSRRALHACLHLRYAFFKGRIFKHFTTWNYFFLLNNVQVRVLYRAQKLVYNVFVGAVENPRTLTVCSSAISPKILICI